MIYKLMLLLLVGTSVLARPIRETTELYVEASVIAGMATIVVDRSNPAKEKVHRIERGTRTGLIYLTNKAERHIRLPTRGFDIERSELEDYDLLTLVWAESSDSKRRIVLPASDIGIAELNQEETARIFFEFAEEWPENRPMRVRFIVSAWVMRKYALDFCDFEVNLAGPGSE